MSVFTKVLKAGEGKKVRRLAELVQPISALEPEMQALSDAALAHKTVEFRERLEQGETLDDLLIESYAVVREAAWRVLGQRHFDVQLMGGMALHFGWIAEMKTGEGKTLVSTLPVYLNALDEQGVHVVTVNDYLATRDAEWMGRLHRWLGLTVGRIGADIDDPASKQAAYAADVTYGTNNEFGFDYLRDNMARSREHMVQRGHVFAIVDEVDSILIDEARTPLIISGPADEAAQLYYQFASIARTLRPGRGLRGRRGEEDRRASRVGHREGGEGGRGRQHLRRGLHQLRAPADQGAHRQGSLQAGQGLPGCGRRSEDHRRVHRAHARRPALVRRSPPGRRGQGTGGHQRGEPHLGHGHPAELLPHVREVVGHDRYRRDRGGRVRRHLRPRRWSPSRPTRTWCAAISPTSSSRRRRPSSTPWSRTSSSATRRASPSWSARPRWPSPSCSPGSWRSRALPHNVLNAKQHFREAEVVAQAGRQGRDHRRHQHGRTGGRHHPRRQPRAAGPARTAGGGGGSDQRRGGGRAAAPAGRRSRSAAGPRAKQVRQLGGLYVLGSERHESRRIDNQLRGRSGRQGDPGESRFYLSLDDELLRLFATGAMSWVMGRTLPEDVPIESKTVAKAIERAQNTVEARNAEMRKDNLKYDEVMDQQRKVIYERRLQIIDGDDLEERTEDLLAGAVEKQVAEFCPSEYPEEWDLKGLIDGLTQYYPTKFSVDDLSQAATTEDLVESIVEEALEYYEQHAESMPGGPETMRQIERDVMLQIIDQRWRDHLAEMDNLKDGIHLRWTVQADPLNAWQSEGYNMFGQLVEVIDNDYLRYILHVEAIQEPSAEPNLERAVYAAAEDPVAGTGALAGVLAAELGANVAPIEQALPPAASSPNGAKAQIKRPNAPDPDALVPIVKAEHEKVGRNDPCWCGSGKKFKLCHGAA